MHGCDMSAHLVIFIALLRLLSPRRLFFMYMYMTLYMTRINIIILLLFDLKIAMSLMYMHMCIAWAEGNTLKPMKAFFLEIQSCTVYEQSGIHIHCTCTTKSTCTCMSL